jgi:phosphate starvation-inducible protein PhoH and related proteins
LNTEGIMARTTRKTRSTASPPDETFIPTKTTRAAVEPLKAQNASQERYIKAIKSSAVTFGIGPAGTGKTYIAGALAAEALRSNTVDKIIVTRPAVDAGESLGFLPGELMEKFEPYIQAFRSVMNERLGKSSVDYMLKHGKIEAIPLAYMRGLTFKNAFVIMDEAQNATPAQMKLFLTRIGNNATVVVNGDLEQQDITGPSGLEDAVARVRSIASCRVVKFSSADIVRSGLVQQIVEAYAQPATR